MKLLDSSMFVHTFAQCFFLLAGSCKSLHVIENLVHSVPNFRLKLSHSVVMSMACCVAVLGGAAAHNCSGKQRQKPAPQ